ncbi:MAG: hypothetical protein WBA16_12340 [Nonlabens sp.]
MIRSYGTYKIRLNPAYLLIFLLGASSSLICAQSIPERLLEKFEQLRSVPEEIISLHLNKSILVQGEDLGFQAYVMDSRTQLPANASRNLYVQLIDDQGATLKEKMLLLNNGVAHNVFEIDSTVTSGNLKIRAFTNWMRNFDNPKYFEAPLKVLSPNMSFIQKDERVKYSLSVIPVSTPIIKNSFTRLNILLTDSYGRGVKSNIDFLKNGELERTVETSKDGFTQIIYLPKNYDVYSIRAKIEEIELIQTIDGAVDSGIVLSPSLINDKLNVVFEVVDQISNMNADSEYFLSVYGAKKINIYPIDQGQINKSISIDVKLLDTGKNKLELINGSGDLIASSTFFNLDGQRYLTDANVTVRRELDSLKINIALPKTIEARVSLSVLPAQTIALDKVNNSVMDFDLAGTVKVASNKAFEDNKDSSINSRYLSALTKTVENKTSLLSSPYVDPTTYTHKFEDGITVAINNNNTRNNEFIIYPTRNNSLESVSLKKGEKKFNFNAFYPYVDEQLKISALDKRNKIKKAEVYPLFYPRSIPNIGIVKPVRELYLDSKADAVRLQPLIASKNKLDTIVLETKIRKERNKRLKNRNRGVVNIFSDQDRRTITSLRQYFNRNNLIANIDNQGLLRVKFRSGRVDAEADPVLVLNDILYFDFQVLIGFDTRTIDYIVFNNTGFDPFVGRDARGGVIRIYTDDNLVPSGVSAKGITNFELPLAFALPSIFYLPGYYDYNSDFYKKLGVIGWKPGLDIEKDSASTTVGFYGDSSVTISIKGLTSDGRIIAFTKTVPVENFR